MSTAHSPRTAAAITDFAAQRRQQVLGDLIGGALGTLWLWLVRWRSRQSLDDIAGDRHLLADIGITPEQARMEAAKPFWRS